MRYHTLGKTGYEVSVIGQGCWNLGNQWKTMTDQEAGAIIHAAFDCGINLFDVADNYGQPNGTSEIRLGKYIKDIRNQIYVVSKIVHWGERSGQSVPYTTPDMIRLCGHASLGRLQTDHLDAVLCHDGWIKDPSVFIEGFEILRKEGFVREYGISTDSLEVLKNFYEQSDGHCSLVEVEYSMVEPRAEQNGFLNFCKEKNLGVLVRGPLAQGVVRGTYTKDTVFTDLVRRNYNVGGLWRANFEKYLGNIDRIKAVYGMENLPELAIRYVISHETQPTAIPGATSVEQVKKNARAGEKLLSEEDLEKIRKLNGSI